MVGRLTLALVVFFGSSIVARETQALEAPPDDRFAVEMKFRQDFGLNSDPAAVMALMSDRTAYDENFPVALTPAERTEMERRIAMEAQMAPLEAVAEMLPGFAGHWIDQPAGGVIKVALVDASRAARAALEPVVPAGASLEIVPARHDLSTLAELQGEVWLQADALHAEGHQVVLIYVDLPTNTVRVGVTGDRDAALAALQARYGEAISVENAQPVTTACTDRYNCAGPPLRGGISAPSNASFPCSLAFLIKKLSTVGWLTAGHCATTIGAVWYHAGIQIGTIRATCWPSCQYSDAARAGELNATYSSNRVYLSGNATGRYVTGSQALNADNRGDYTCLNARRSESWRCGYIENDNAYVCYQYNQYGNCTIWYTEQRLASFPNANGDSGGAVHSAYTGRGVVAYGVESGCTYMPNGDTCSGYGIYSHIARVLSELGGWSVCSSVTPCE